MLPRAFEVWMPETKMLAMKAPVPTPMISVPKPDGVQRQVLVRERTAAATRTPSSGRSGGRRGRA